MIEKEPAQPEALAGTAETRATYSRRKYASPRQLRRQSGILAAARDMLDEVGYAGMTMRDLAKRANVAQGTLYNLYENKDALILAAVVELLDRLAAEALRRRPRPGIDAILNMIVVTSEQIVRTPRYAEAMARCLGNASPGDPLIEQLYRRTEPLVAEQLAIARDNGELRPEIDLDAVCTHLVAQGWGVIWAWVFGAIPLEAIIDERIRSYVLTLSGITVGEAQASLRRRLADLSS
ncbi:MAG: TetR/AcrR family transcriptional regulator [Pseudomonadota bacterium]